MQILEADVTTATDILDRLNQLMGKRYQYKGSIKKHLDARIEEYSADEVLQVVEQKHVDWKDDPKMREYIRPATLFGKEKCEEYVGALKSPDTQAVSSFDTHCRANGCPLRATNSRNRDRSGGLCTWHENSYPEQWPQITSRIVENRPLIKAVLKFEAMCKVDQSEVVPVEFCGVTPESTNPWEWMRQLDGVCHRRIRHDLKPVERQETRLGSLIANSGILGKSYEQD